MNSRKYFNFELIRLEKDVIKIPFNHLISLKDPPLAEK